jgi:hypothetical protein
MSEVTFFEEVLGIPERGADPATLWRAAAARHERLLTEIPVLAALHTLSVEWRVLRHPEGLKLRHVLVPSGQLRLDLAAPKRRPSRSLPAFEQDIARIRHCIQDHQERLDRAAPVLRREVDGAKDALARLDNDLLPLLKKPGSVRGFLPDDEQITLSVPMFDMEVPDADCIEMHLVVVGLSRQEARILPLRAVSEEGEVGYSGKLVLRPQRVRFTNSQMEALSRSLTDGVEVRLRGFLLRHALTDTVVGAQVQEEQETSAPPESRAFDAEKRPHNTPQTRNRKSVLPLSEAGTRPLRGRSKRARTQSF